MKISILTLFSGKMFRSRLTQFQLSNSARKKRLLEIAVHKYQDFGLGSNKMVDDTPYGGGIGMVLKG